MHPWDHAKSSAQSFGGDPEAFTAFHSWFDQTKVAAAKPGHRMFRHHHEGILEGIDIYGAQITSSENKPVDALTLGRQHLMEDCGRVPRATEWLENFPIEYVNDRLTTVDFSGIRDYLPMKMASRFGGQPEDYRPIHDWFMEPATWHDDNRYIVLRHHSFGIFAAEQKFGLVITRKDNVKVPIRLIAEHHVRTIFKTIPSTAEIIRNLRLQPWMNAASKPQSLR
jgi:hypothetical protein